MLKKIICIVGIIASLLAAEGLHRFGGFISAMNGADAPFYMGMLAAALVVAALFIVAMVGKLSGLFKIIGIILLAVSIALMFFAPALPVNQQIIGSQVVALLCFVFAPKAAAK